MTREEALEIIRKNMPSDKSLPVYEAIQTLIPELAESEDEDERIRKWLYDYIYNCPNESFEFYGGVGKKAVLAYLEKQKELFESGRGLYYYDGEKTTYCGYSATEENPYDFAISQQEKQKERLADNSKTLASDDDRIRNEILVYIGAKKDIDLETHNRWCSYLEKQKDQKQEDLPAGFYVTLNGEKYYAEEVRCNGMNVKVVGPKPVEWDEYTKTNLDRALQIIKKAKGTLQGYQSDDGIYECDKAIECLEHFLYRGLEIEKPVEWDEFDEDCLKRAAWYIENPAPSMVKDTNLALWLKSLPGRFNFQPKQEWNDEDERKYQCIRNILLTDMDKKVGSWKYSEILEWYEKRGIGRYTNYKPSWKPSEEQMKALQNAVALTACDKELARLYNQLKKL